MLLPTCTTSNPKGRYMLSHATAPDHKCAECARQTQMFPQLAPEAFQTATQQHSQSHS